MKRFLEKKYVNTGFALAIIILISVSILTYLNTSNYLKDQGYVKETLLTIQASEALLSRLIEAETSRRREAAPRRPSKHASADTRAPEVRCRRYSGTRDEQDR